MSEKLIENTFPLRQSSLDSTHEKMCHSGHIKALHIWPARRPLAACRAALIATLLPDPGNTEERRKVSDRIGGRIVPRIEKKNVNGNSVKVEREETIGGILHWGRESDPDVQFFRDEIRKAYGGRAPRVLDPFAGGGAIPLEAMRLGCEVTAIDINPVAWFILKCTLEYPQKLAGQKRRLPDFVLHDRDFMESFLKAHGFKGATLRTQLERIGLEEGRVRSQALFPADVNKSEPQEVFNLGSDESLFDADLVWHVRAWGWWVLQKSKVDLERFYPTIDGKPPLAYLWARTVKCKNCRATLPLLKSKWLCKKEKKRILLKVEANSDNTGPTFKILRGAEAATQGGNGAQRREYDKKMGAGTMSRSGATCVCCKLPSMTMEDIRIEGKAGRLGAVLTTVLVDGPDGKDYRLPTDDDINSAAAAENELQRVFADIPFGIPNEPLPSKEALGFRVPLYGLDQWHKLFTPRQLLSLGIFVTHARKSAELVRSHYSGDVWHQAIGSYLACVIDKLADYNSDLVPWQPKSEKGSNTFSRWAIPIKWDFVEVAPLYSDSGGWRAITDWVSEPIGGTLLTATKNAPDPTVLLGSAIDLSSNSFDLIVTDPPYYDAIPYSDATDFFYVWLRRSLRGLSPENDNAFRNQLGPKWDIETKNGELIDDASRFGGDREASKTAYEDGMFRAFQACDRALLQDGRMVVVFANKSPDAWETLVSAMIRAGFVVDASWPIQTEMGNRTRAQSSAALASSVWLVCRKRPDDARPGWDNRVLDEMRENIYDQLREYWDAGIRGPDFVWAATGPAMEAYSKHPVVKKANEPNATMEVSEFLRAVRRIVVDFVVGRVLTRNGDVAVTTGLDDVTTYYLLHRHDFGMDDAPIGACILYAISCGLSDHDLADRHEILQKTGGQTESEDEETGEPAAEDANGEAEEGTGSKVRLRPWNRRIRKGMGYDGDGGTAAGKPAPLIDQVHRMMHLWKAGDLVRVDEYLEARGLRRSALFHQLLQALIELAPAASEERSFLESISNHIAARPAEAQDRQSDMFVTEKSGGSSR
jgi:putative DNA methylase